MTDRIPLRPDQMRQPGESMVDWLNRLRVERGVDGIEWYATSGGDLRLRPSRNPQSKMEF